MPWRKGESGNKTGRPPKGRALAQVLRQTGEFDSYGDLTNQQLLAQMVWEGLAMGTITFSSGRTLELNVKEWLELVKWVHAHVDGTYRPEEQENDKEDKDEEPEYDLPEERRVFETQMERIRRIHGEEYARHIAETQQRKIAERAGSGESSAYTGEAEFALSEES
jgi:hypothetical protein